MSKEIKLPFRRRDELEKPINKRPDFGSNVVPRSIGDLIHRHGENLIGEIVEIISGTYYVVRGISYLKGETEMRGFRATQLGDYTRIRPRIVFMPSNARVIITNSLKRRALSTNSHEYKKILQEINKEGGNIEIPPERKGQFNLH